MRLGTGRIAGTELPGKWRTSLRSRRDQARQRAGRPERDGGFTLVEVVMTIVLISLVIIPIIDATFTSVKASTTAREVAEVETVLQNAADRVNRAPTLCDYEIYVQAAALSNGWQADQASADYFYYQPGASALASDPGSWIAGACEGGVRTPRLIQMVVITVRSESGTINRSIQVVKSDV